MKALLVAAAAAIASASPLHAAQYDLSWTSIDGGATLMSGGNVTLEGTAGQCDAGALTGGPFALQGGFWATRNHLLLTIDTAASASPNPAAIGTSVAFTVTQSIPNATIDWDFGDGSVGATGTPASHTYAAPGLYDASMTVLDVASGQTLVQHVSVSIGTTEDTDSDGFIDELEVALGTDPRDAGSTPFGGAPAGAPQPIVISKASVRLAFAKSGADSIRLSGSLPVPAGFAVTGETAVVYFGGVTRTFTLDKKGKSPKGNDGFAIKIKAKKGVVAAQTAKFTAKISKGTLAPQLADEGLDGSATVKKVARSVRVIVLFDRTLFQTTKTLTYSATQGKTGAAK